MTEAELRAGHRRRPVAQARAAMATAALRGLGLPAAGVARALGVTPMAVLRGVARGEAVLRGQHLEAERLARDVFEKVN